ncbi:DUF397 domain-containing protein [Actinomadura harenae]|uniref:DUF397 domain-containing protein n=1 Tax=Actinomadura harenae TaxID=2483351 RepID=A0A3M2LL47_9ACTN|nr:DUF397 domain-containing protein [Actinomadura harenae]RMI38164.1 DUF397 domain-containing protein [Actinomadura harenae]
MDLNRPQWRRSSYSGPDGGNCVEVAPSSPAQVAFRDSKNPVQGRLTLCPSHYAQLLHTLKNL